MFSVCFSNRSCWVDNSAIVFSISWNGSLRSGYIDLRVWFLSSSNSSDDVSGKGGYKGEQHGEWECGEQYPLFCLSCLWAATVFFGCAPLVALSDLLFCSSSTRETLSTSFCFWSAVNSCGEIFSSCDAIYYFCKVEQTEVVIPFIGWVFLTPKKLARYDSLGDMGSFVSCCFSLTSPPKASMAAAVTFFLSFHNF